MGKSVTWLLKVFNGYKVEYNEELKCNKFIVKLDGHVVAKYKDFYSCLKYIERHVGNFYAI